MQSTHLPLFAPLSHVLPEDCALQPARTCFGCANRLAYGAPAGPWCVAVGLATATAGDLLGRACLACHNRRADLAGASLAGSSAHSSRLPCMLKPNIPNCIIT